MYNSLFEWTSLRRDAFVGIHNFGRIFGTPPYQERFFNALGNNVKWFLITMLVQNSIGLLFGYLLYRKVAGYRIYQRLFFIPVLFPIVAVGFLWNLYLNPDGLVNTVLSDVGLGSMTQAWLGDAAIATYSIIAVNIWRWVGFPTLVFYAAINNIPHDFVESAILDGASEWKRFWRIVLPLIIPAITIITVLTTIGTLNVFEQIYTMTGLSGGPYYSTDTLGTLFYRTAFGSVDSGIPEIGVGSAIGVVIYALTFVASFGAVIALRRREETF